MDELVTVLHARLATTLVFFKKKIMTVPKYGLSGIKVCETASCHSLDAHPPDRLDQGSGNRGCSRESGAWPVYGVERLDLD